MPGDGTAGGLERLSILMLDVDGVLTDGTVVIDIDGDARRIFHVQDGYALKLWHDAGGRVAIVTGRASEVIRSRAAALGIEWVYMGVDDKLAAYHKVLHDAGVGDEYVAYVGDDLPDLPPMKRCGFPVAVANAVPALKRVAHYVTRRGGGQGPIAEVVELLLRKQQRWTSVLHHD